MSTFKRVVLLPYAEYLQLLKSSGKEHSIKQPQEVNNITRKNLGDLLLQDNLHQQTRGRVEGDIFNEDYPESVGDAPTYHPDLAQSWGSNWEPIQ